MRRPNVHVGLITSEFGYADETTTKDHLPRP